MPRNGSGVYGLPGGSTAVPNTTIESSPYNAALSDLADALTDSINVDGTAPFQANQPMGNHKLTGLSAGSATTDSLTLAQAQSGIVSHAASVGGTADAITATFSPAFAAWTAKMRFRFTAGGANTVTNPTINVDGLGAKTLKKLHGQALAAGDITGSGHIVDCVYDGTDVLILNASPPITSIANTFTAKQTFNGPVVHGTTTLTDDATIAWDLATGGPNYKVTIAASRTLGAFSNGTAGQHGFLTVIQDGTGGWALDLSNAVYDFHGGFIENIARGAGDETVYHYRLTASNAMLLKRMGATSIGGSGRDLLSEQTASGSATINFVLTKWLQLYDRFEIDLEDVLAATDAADFSIRTSSDGGSNYDSGGSDYAWAKNTVWASGNSPSTDSADGAIDMFEGASNTAGESISGRVTIYNPRAAARTKIGWDLTGFSEDAASRLIGRVTGGGARLAAADVDAIRFLMSSGNIASGTFRLYGVRK